MIQLPDDLAQDAGPHVGVALRKFQAADQAADPVVGVCYRAAVEEAAEAKGLGQNLSEAFHFAGVGSDCFFGEALEFRRGLGAADQFVKAEGDRLAEIHGDVLFARGNPHQPVAVAEILVGQAEFFRAEEERDTI